MSNADSQTGRDALGESQNGTDRARRHCSLRSRKSRDGQCDDRAERNARPAGPQPRPRRGHQSVRPLRAGQPPCLRRRLELARGTAAVQDRGAGREAAHHHHPQRIRPTSPSTARSIPIAAASMAASTASRGRRTPIWACRPGSISNRSCSPSRMRRELLEKELSKAGYEPRTIAIGTNTDPYQPIEKQLAHHARDPRSAGGAQPSGRHRHQVGAGDARHRHPVAHGRTGLAKVALSVTTLDRKLARTMEPRAATPTKRLEAIRPLSEAGIPTSVMVAPIIPGLNDHGDRAHPRCGARRRRARGRLRHPAPAARGQPDLQGLAAAPLSRPLPARDVAGALDARRQGLRCRMGQADEGHRPLCLADRPALRDRGQAARPQREQPPLRTDLFVAAPKGERAADRCSRPACRRDQRSRSLRKFPSGRSPRPPTVPSRSAAPMAGKALRRIGADASIAAPWLARVPILRPSSTSSHASPTSRFETEGDRRDGLWPVAGIDEAGRGPLAGRWWRRP